MAGNDLKLYNFKSFCSTFFSIILLPIFFRPTAPRMAPFHSPHLN